MSLFVRGQIGHRVPSGQGIIELGIIELGIIQLGIIQLGIIELRLGMRSGVLPRSLSGLLLEPTLPESALAGELCHCRFLLAG